MQLAAQSLILRSILVFGNAGFQHHLLGLGLEPGVVTAAMALHLRAYAKFDGADPAHPPDRQSHGIPVMVGITAQPGMAQQRAPVDLVVLLHIIRRDNSLPSNWENLLMEAMDAIVNSLDDTSCLAVIPGQSALMAARKFRPHNIPYVTTTLVKALESAELVCCNMHDFTIIVVFGSNWNCACVCSA